VARAETANLLKPGPALQEFIVAEIARIEKEKTEKRK
jgi:hypothetical protein